MTKQIETSRLSDTQTSRVRFHIRHILLLLVVSMVGLIAPTIQAQDIESDYAPVNGLELYYEIHGSGDPLILLHGGVGASEMFATLIPELAEQRQVIAVHLQGHGHTVDIDRPLSIEFMADDIAALIEYLELGQVDVMGYSLGGMVALQTTIRHPELVRRLVLVSVAYAHDGSYPEVLAAFDAMDASTGQFMEQSPLYELYPEVDWGNLFEKLGELMRQDYDWSEDVAEITTPTFLIYADADSIQISHIMEFYRLLGGGQGDAGQVASGRPITRLAILPNTTHYDVFMSPYLGSMVSSFLDLELPQSD